MLGKTHNHLVQAHDPQTRAHQKQSIPPPTYLAPAGYPQGIAKRPLVDGRPHQNPEYANKRWISRSECRLCKTSPQVACPRAHTWLLLLFYPLGKITKTVCLRV